MKTESNRTVALLVVALALIAGCGGHEEPVPPSETTADDDGSRASRPEPPPEGHGRQAILEKARQRGALIWGGGNEPGWNVEIGPELTTFVTSYGEVRHEFTTPQPTLDEPNGRTTYRTRFESHEIVVEIRRETCNDTMSDETFPLHLRVELDGRELRGCAVALAETGR